MFISVFFIISMNFFLMLFFPFPRDDIVDLVDSYQYEDNQHDDFDAFAREPYILRFKCHNTGQFGCIITKLHALTCECVDLFMCSFCFFMSACSHCVCGACESILCLEQQHDSDLVRRPIPRSRRQVYQVESVVV